jgi:hypothetical protein
MTLKRIYRRGDYEALNQNFANKAETATEENMGFNGRKSGFGYASCIQYIPNSDGKSLVSVGVSGLYYSYDSGNSWKQLATDSSLFTIRFIDNQQLLQVKIK